jgi:hypothetical protein
VHDVARTLYRASAQAPTGRIERASMSPATDRRLSSCRLSLKERENVCRVAMGGTETTTLLPACTCRRQQKSTVKPGRSAIAGRGWLEIVCWMCQSATGRVALLAPVGKQAGCRDVGRHSSVVPGAGTPSAVRGKASPDETERVGRGHLIDLHGFPEEGRLLRKDGESCAA